MYILVITSIMTNLPVIHGHGFKTEGDAFEVVKILIEMDDEFITKKWIGGSRLIIETTGNLIYTIQEVNQS